MSQKKMSPHSSHRLGDFVDVTEREGLKGFNFTPLDQKALEESILECLNSSEQTVASIQLQLLRKTKTGNFNVLRRAKNSALRLQEISCPDQISTSG